nr:MAG TPA: hypothetical protein [Caudoviricetes sp.]
MPHHLTSYSCLFCKFIILSYMFLFYCIIKSTCI